MTDEDNPCEAQDCVVAPGDVCMRCGQDCSEEGE